MVLGKPVQSDDLAFIAKLVEDGNVVPVIDRPTRSPTQLKRSAISRQGTPAANRRDDGAGVAARLRAPECCAAARFGAAFSASSGWPK